MTRPDQTRPDQNYGLSLLKIWMCFEVVLCHFWDAAKDFSPALKPFNIARPLAVMTFMFMAFLLTGQSIINRDKHKIRRRINRLVIMHVCWAVIYFAAHLLEALLLGRGLLLNQSIFSILKMLLLQIIFGHTLNQVMWFQVDLIFISAMLAVICYVMGRRKALICIGLIGLAALAAQYTGVNYMLFGDMGSQFSAPLGRICEVLPLACVGVLCVSFGVMDRLSQHRIVAIIACAVLFVLTVKLRGYIPEAEGFAYSGLYLNIAAILLTVIFYLLPMDNIPKGIISTVSRYTPGIYCMHNLFGLCFKMIFHIENSFIFCIVIFITCLAVSILISKIFGKAAKYLVA